MRLSADMDAPDYFYHVLADRGESDPLAMRVFVDGEENDRVLVADDVEGWADLIPVFAPGECRHVDSCEIRRVYGRVEFRIGERVL